MSEINDTVQALYKGYTPLFNWPTYRYQVSGLDNGIYFFKIVAYNEYGNYSINSFRVVVKIPKEDDTVIEKGTSLFEINPEIILVLIFAGMMGTLILVLLKHKKLRLSKTNIKVRDIKSISE